MAYAVFLIPESVDVQQVPSFLEQAIDIFSAARFQVVARQFDDIELPQRWALGYAGWNFAWDRFCTFFSHGCSGPCNPSPAGYTAEVKQPRPFPSSSPGIAFHTPS